MKLASVKKGLLGADAPECNSDGTYKQKQCHSSSGYCWCVDSKTGNVIDGTKKGPSEGDVLCGRIFRIIVFLSFFLSPMKNHL